MTPRAIALRAATALALALVALPGVAAAQTVEQAAPEVAAPVPAEDVRAIYDALGLPGTIEVMAQEGREDGATLAEQVFRGQPAPAEWTDTLASIYEPGRMEEAIVGSLAQSLAGEDVRAMVTFLEAEPGRSLVELELAAREAMLDEDVEEAAKEAAAVALAEESPRVALVRRYAEANDLIETNVVAAMNSNTAYLMGLLDGGAMQSEMTESDVLADVWAQEAEIRATTTEWVMSFLLMAYQPATDADIEAIIAFSETEPGQALNRAVFEAFDEMFEDVSRSLGLASARYMTTQEL